MSESQKGLSDEERAALGEPPGRAQMLERTRAARAERELKRIEEELDEVEAYRMPLMEHLKELSSRTIKALVALVITTAASFYFAIDIYEFLKAPFVAALADVEGVEGSLALVHSPFEGVYVWFKVSLVAGLLGASPVIAYQAWSFIAPGLYNQEKRIVLPLTVSSVALFVAGAGFCFYGIFPYAFPFFIEVLGVDVNLSADGYLSAVIRMMLAFGLCFQLPVGAFFLARIGLVDHIDLAKGFRFAIVGIFVLAAIITPPDPLTQVLLAVPMVLLYAVGIVVAWMFSTKTRDELTA
jgi:sec-independent protein translocase protein TatC